MSCLINASYSSFFGSLRRIYAELKAWLLSQVALPLCPFLELGGIRHCQDTYSRSHQTSQSHFRNLLLTSWRLHPCLMYWTKTCQERKGLSRSKLFHESIAWHLYPFVWLGQVIFPSPHQMSCQFRWLIYSEAGGGQSQIWCLRQPSLLLCVCMVASGWRWIESDFEGLLTWDVANYETKGQHLVNLPSGGRSSLW